MLINTLFLSNTAGENHSGNKPSGTDKLFGFLFSEIMNVDGDNHKINVVPDYLGGNLIDYKSVFLNYNFESNVNINKTQSGEVKDPIINLSNLFLNQQIPNKIDINEADKIVYSPSQFVNSFAQLVNSLMKNEDGANNIEIKLFSNNFILSQTIDKSHIPNVEKFLFEVIQNEPTFSLSLSAFNKQVLFEIFSQVVPSLLTEDRNNYLEGNYQIRDYKNIIDDIVKLEDCSKSEISKTPNVMSEFKTGNNSIIQTQTHSDILKDTTDISLVNFKEVENSLRKKISDTSLTNISIHSNEGIKKREETISKKNITSNVPVLSDSNKQSESITNDIKTETADLKLKTVSEVGTILKYNQKVEKESEQDLKHNDTKVVIENSHNKINQTSKGIIELSPNHPVAENNKQEQHPIKIIIKSNEQNQNTGNTQYNLASLNKIISEQRASNEISQVEIIARTNTESMAGNTSEKNVDGKQYIENQLLTEKQNQYLFRSIITDKSINDINNSKQIQLSFVQKPNGNDSEINDTNRKNNPSGTAQNNIELQKIKSNTSIPDEVNKKIISSEYDLQISSNAKKIEIESQSPSVRNDSRVLDNNYEKNERLFEHTQLKRDKNNIEILKVETKTEKVVENNAAVNQKSYLNSKEPNSGVVNKDYVSNRSNTEINHSSQENDNDSINETINIQKNVSNEMLNDKKLFSEKLSSSTNPIRIVNEKPAKNIFVSNLTTVTEIKPDANNLLSFTRDDDSTNLQNDTKTVINNEIRGQAGNSLRNDLNKASNIIEQNNSEIRESNKELKSDNKNINTADIKKEHILSASSIKVADDGKKVNKNNPDKNNINEGMNFSEKVKIGDEAKQKLSDNLHLKNTLNSDSKNLNKSNTEYQTKSINTFNGNENNENDSVEKQIFSESKKMNTEFSADKRETVQKEISSNKENNYTTQRDTSQSYSNNENKNSTSATQNIKSDMNDDANQESDFNNELNNIGSMNDKKTKHSTLRPNIENNPSNNLIDIRKVFDGKTLENFVKTVNNNNLNYRAELSNSNQFNSIELKLYPEELGRVKIIMDTSEKVVSARIEVQSEQAKNLILSNMNILREALNKDGLNINSLSVYVGSEEDKNQNQTNQKKKNGNNKMMFSAEDQSEEIKIKNLGYNTIEYLA